MTTPLSQDEIAILSSNHTLRQAKDNSRIKICNRVLDIDIRFDNFVWSKVDFENCDFINCSMYHGMLQDVQFLNCLFFSNTWRHGTWENVLFKDCAWKGPFNMGAPKGVGTVSFLDCEFVGATEEELGYGGKAETFGSIGGTNGNVNYQHCGFKRVYINGGSATIFDRCEMLDVVIFGKNGSSIFFNKLTAAGLVDVSNGRFSSVRIADSEFKGRLTFNDTHIEKALFENVKVNLDLTLVKANSVEVKGVTFVGAESPKSTLQYGLTCELAKLEQLAVIDCRFQGYGARFHLSGEEPPHQIHEGNDPKLASAYSTTVDRLFIRNTPIDDGSFEYMNIGQFVLENLVLGNANFSNSSIQNFVTRNVRQSGQLKLENTKIVRKESDLQLQ